MIAALYVADEGCYYGLPNVIPYGLPHKDAREYKGPYPVIAHPPCARWGRYWMGSPSSPKRFKYGDDGGCFEAALKAVRKYGGVLEHPKSSTAFKTFGINSPSRDDGWVDAGDGIGKICCIEQAFFGHNAKKSSLLYAVRVALPKLPKGKFRGRTIPLEHLSKIERAATPIQFRDLLISIVESVR